MGILLIFEVTSFPKSIEILTRSITKPAVQRRRKNLRLPQSGVNIAACWGPSAGRLEAVVVSRLSIPLDHLYMQSRAEFSLHPVDEVIRSRR